MSIQRNDKQEQERQAAQQSTALRRAANALFHHQIDKHDKAQVLAAVRACAQGRANAAQHKELLAERARLIPTFHVFRSLVLEDLRAAYDEDRQNKTRSAKNRRLSWLALYKPFAVLRGIKKALDIKALDRSGNYQCELVEREAPDEWRPLCKVRRGLWHHGAATHGVIPACARAKPEAGVTHRSREHNMTQSKQYLPATAGGERCCLGMEANRVSGWQATIAGGEGCGTNSGGEVAWCMCVSEVGGK